MGASPLMLQLQLCLRQALVHPPPCPYSCSVCAMHAFTYRQLQLLAFMITAIPCWCLFFQQCVYLVLFFEMFFSIACHDMAAKPTFVIMSDVLIVIMTKSILCICSPLRMGQCVCVCVCVAKFYCMEGHFDSFLSSS